MIIVALDFPSASQALELVDKLDPSRCKLKVGKELFTRAGPSLVQELVKRNFKVFLDLKYHDIPNTVANACAAAADLGVWMLNVHALGGRKMLEAARSSIDNNNHNTLLIAVTILTSMNDADIAELGINSTTAETVTRLAKLTEQAGLDGVVCSPLEISRLRKEVGEAFKLVTPGIRPAGSAKGDQQRIMTPAQAITAGASYLVIGRPITAAADPLAALTAIEQELS